MNIVHSAVRWKLVDQAAIQGIAFLAAVALARLVTPAEFGLFAMLYLPLALADLLAKGGLGEALVQRQDITEADESTVFWFTLAVSGALAALLFLAAPAVAAFFEQPRLTLLLRVLVLDLLLSALGSVSVTRMRKALDFRRLALLSALSITGGSAVAVALALAGWGVWALVAQLLITNVLRLGLLLVLDDWRPRPVFVPGRFRRLFGFGGYMMMGNVVTLVAQQAYTLFVGKLYTAADLGIFNRAMSTRTMPKLFIGNAYRDVGLPVLARLVDDPASWRDTYRASLVAVMALSLPVMTGLALVAGDLVPALFGPNWYAVVPYLQILCIGGVAWALNMVNLNALRALGAARTVFRLQLAAQGVLLAVVAVTAPVSLVALALGLAAVEFGAAVVAAQILGRRADYGLGRQLRDLAPYLGLLALMVVAVLIQRWLWPADGHAVGLLLSVAVGAAVYLLPMFALRLEAVDQGLMLLRRSPRGSATPEPPRPAP